MSGVMLSSYMEEELEENDDLMLWQNVVVHVEEVGSISFTMPSCTTTKSSCSGVTTSYSSSSGGQDSRPFSDHPAGATSHPPASHSANSATITSTLLLSGPLQQPNALQTACAPGVHLQFISSFFGCYCKRAYFFLWCGHT